MPPVRKQRGVKRKALLAEFDPLLSKKDRGGPPPFQLYKEFTNQLRDYRANVPHGHGLEGDALTFLSAMQPGIEAQLNDQLFRQHGVKYSQVLTVELEKLAFTVDNVYDDKAAPGTVTTTAYFRSKPEPITNAGNIKGVVQAAKAEVLKHLESYTNEGSGWRLKRVMALDICIAKLSTNSEVRATSQHLNTYLLAQS